MIESDDQTSKYERQGTNVTEIKSATYNKTASMMALVKQEESSLESLKEENYVIDMLEQVQAQKEYIEGTKFHSPQNEENVVDLQDLTVYEIKNLKKPTVGNNIAALNGPFGIVTKLDTSSY